MTRKGYKHTPEARAKMSKSRAGRRLSQEHCRRISEGKTGKPLSAEHRKALSEARKRYLSTPEAAETIRRVQAGLRDNPEWAKNQREGSLRRSEKPEWRRNNAAQLSRLHADTDMWRRMGASTSSSPKARAHRERMSTDPELLKRRGESIRSNPEWQSSHREMLRRIRDNPSTVARMVRTQNPSKYELALREFLPPDFIATGRDVTKRVAGKFPDYQWPERKLAVEMDAHWIHRDNRGIILDWARDALFTGLGWRTLRVKPEEMKDPDLLRQRITEFVHGPANRV
jgi:very-short-patch-repair endonuclease